MKITPHLFILLFMVLFTACKRDTCSNSTCGPNEVCLDGECWPVNIACGSHQHLENNACVCDSGWLGPQCDIPQPLCVHGYMQDGGCICDYGWSGEFCNTPQSGTVDYNTAESFIGNYHVTGTRSTYGQYANSYDIDDTMQVRSSGYKLVFEGYEHAPGSYMSWNTRFVYYPSCNNCYSIVTFKKHLKDSIFYEMRNGGIGSGSTAKYTGVKVE